MNPTAAQYEYPDEDKQILTLDQQQQLNSWKDRVHKFLLDAWPYFYRFFNDFLMYMLKIIRSFISTAKEEMFNR
jgi:hypothetical protein